MPWEDVKSLFRPEGVHMGVMKADPKRCTRTRGSSCQLCSDNCPSRAWELSEGQAPRLAEAYSCLSCYNCLVACPRNAIAIVESYHVDSGFFQTLPRRLEARPPARPLDADGNPGEWTAIEKAVFNRRSARNFKDKPVPESLLRRVLEAGRFAPSGCNCQPWRFIVLSDKALMSEIDEAVRGRINLFSRMYQDDDLVKQLAAAYEKAPRPGGLDPRTTSGAMTAISRKNRPILHNAPAAILLLEDERAVGGSGINTGICGQNMTLAANSLGLGACWVGLAAIANDIPSLTEKLGISYPWKIAASLALGYPLFKQEGAVPREYRPVTWLREGVAPVED